MIEVVQKPTPNFRAGKVPRQVRGVVLHVIEGSLSSADSWFSVERSRVSAHFGIGLDGRLHQYVSVHDIAWHAGTVDRPTWKGLTPGAGGPNEYTVGIEHEGSGATEWTEEMLSTSALLSAWLCQRFKLQPNGLYFPLHREIRASKTCPGPAFDRSAYLARVAWNLRFLGGDLKRFFKGLR